MRATRRCSFFFFIRSAGIMTSRIGASLCAALFAAASCASPNTHPAGGADDHGAHSANPSAGATGQAQPSDARLPAGAATVAARLAASTRHGEYVMIPRAGQGDSIRAWVVYPERRDKAPVVLVIHEIYGLSTWIRGVADQLAADGYIAVAPDLLSGKYTVAPGDTLLQAQASTLIRSLTSEAVQGDLRRVADYATSLPAAQPRFGVVGFCWGGSTSFNTAVSAHPRLRGAVVYYGGSPATSALSAITAPVLGLYGENDARVNATIPSADSAMRALRKTYEPVTLAGAGHGFLRQQDGQNGANLAATRDAWPRTLAFFRRTLGR
jgi:carboxymethylenebutenolidase